MGFRTLLFVLALGAIFWIVRYMARNARARVDKRQDVEKPVQRMVRCAHCGVHVPSGEAVQADDRWYCSAEHRAKGPTSDEP
jgi:uncharacterized protein